MQIRGYHENSGYCPANQLTIRINNGIPNAIYMVPITTIHDN